MSRATPITSSEARAKNSWLLSFGDVITLMITFFILLIAVNKGEITKIQKWSDEQVESSYHILQSQVEQAQLPIEIKYSLEGIKLILKTDQSFASADYHPLPRLKQTLRQVAGILKALPLMNLRQNPQTAEFIKKIEATGYHWYLEVDVEGYTDNDPVNPKSPVRNNWILSALRAQTVADLLAENSGLPHHLFATSGYGQYRPLVPNDSPEHKAKNRRIEITIIAYFQKLK
ncbi:OmpA/MotB family protein [Galenea microaerophila]